MAGGQFNELVLPQDPGFYVNFIAAAQLAIQGGDNGTVLVPFTADWGPVEEFHAVTSQAEYEALYSSSTGGTGRYAVLGALQGGGAGRNGATKVLCYRLADSSAAKATLQLQNTTPATMLTLTAKYEGVRPANWTVTVQTNAVDNTTKDIILYENGVELERFEKILATSASAFVTAINDTTSGSKFYTASAGTTGTALANVTATAFNTSAGNSGLTPIGSDYTAFQTAAENQEFQLLAPAELSDDTIRTALVTWAETRNAAGQRFMLVVGGVAGETFDTAKTSALAYNNENVVRLGYTDFYDSDGTTVISTAKFAPRYAGMIADAGITRSTTQQRVSGVTLKVVPTADQIKQAREDGLMVFTTDSRGVKVQLDVTSYSGNTSTKPKIEFGKIRQVRIHQQVERDLRAASEAWIGGDSINVGPVQKNILGEIAGYLRTLEDSLILQPGWSVDLNSAQDNTQDALHIAYGIATTKAIERIFNYIVLQ